MKRELFFAFLLIALSLSIFIVSGDEQSAVAQELKGNGGSLKCKTDVISSIATAYSGEGADIGNLKALVERLRNHSAQAQELALKGNREEYRNFLKNSFDPDFKEAKRLVEELKKEKTNLTKEQRENIRTKTRQAFSFHKQCKLESGKEEGRGRIVAFNSILESKEMKIEKMKERGVNTTLLEKVISDAREKIINQMQKEVSVAKDEKTVESAVKKYCLFDGCEEGVNYHFAARFEVAKLETVLEEIKIKKRDNSMINELSEHIKNAKSALEEVGNSKYTEEGKKRVWESIRKGHKVIREIQASLKGKNIELNSTSNRTKL